MKSLARRLLVPTLLLFGVLVASAVAVGAFTNDDIAVVPAQVAVPAQIGTDGGSFLSDVGVDAGLDAPEIPDMSLTDAADGGVGLNPVPPIPADGPISLLP